MTSTDPPSAARPLPSEILGQSDAFLAFSEALSRAAKVDRPILIIGERGTGKELAAAKLHYLSPRWQGPLVALNCAALTPTLIESELFGYEAGAFTGAESRREGRFETAHNGTLFLDEIANAPLTVQEKILRVVEYGVFERVGSSRPVQVEVRLVGATNADLGELVKNGRFKQDLLDRLSFEVLTPPPLRERGEDIMLLATHFAARMAHELGRPGAPLFSQAAVSALMNHEWPGNVRELKNVVERAIYRSDSDEIHQLDFDPFAPSRRRPRLEAEPGKEPGTKPAKQLPPNFSLKTEMAKTERDFLKQALNQGRFSQTRTAKILGLSYHQLRGLIRKHGGLESLSEE